MTEIKWIKLTTTMFEDEKIDFIESLPDADAILIIWIKLLTLAGKCNANGYIFLTENIPYDENMLAHKFKRPINTVKMALETFERLRMLERTQQGLCVVNWEKHQNIQGMEKIREQNRLRNIKYRQNQKQLLLNDVTMTSHDATDIDIDIDKDINNIPSKNQKIFSLEDKEYLLAEYLSKKISERLNKPLKYDKTIQKWSAEFEKMIRLDKYSIEEIKEVLIFSQNNDFWQSNILSASKFRKQYITLLAQLKRENKKGGDNFGKPGNGIKFNVPKTKVDTGEDLDRTIEELGLI